MSDTGTMGQSLHEALEQLRNNDPNTMSRIDRLLISYPDAVSVVRARAQAREAAENWQGAAEDYARVVEILPDDVDMLLALARCQMRANNTFEGMLTARQVLDHDPANRDAKIFIRMAGEEADREQIGALARAQEKFATGQTQRAINDVRAFVAKDGERMDAQVMLARLFWQSGRHIAASDVCQRILDNEPDCLFAHVLLHQFWLMARNPGQADLYLAEVNRLDPDHRVSAAAFGDLAATLPVKDAPAEMIITRTPAYARNEERAEEDAQDRAAWVDELAASSAMLRTKVQPAYSPEEGPVADYFPLDWSPMAEPKLAVAETPAPEPPVVMEAAPAAQPIPQEQPARAPAPNAEEKPSEILALPPAEQTQAGDDAPPWEEQPAQEAAAPVVVAPAPATTPSVWKVEDEWQPADAVPVAMPVAPAPPALRKLITPRPRRAAQKPPPEPVPNAKKKAGEILESAREATGRGNFKEALKQIEEVVNRGKKPRETITLLEDIVERLNPRSQKSLVSETYQLLSLAYMQAGRPDDAQTAMQRK